MPRPIVAVWFSCGAASAVAARIAVDTLSDLYDVRIVNTPVANEDTDNRRFFRDVEAWLGQRIELATNPKWPTNDCEDVWEARGYMSGTGGAVCTVELKKGARYAYEDAHKIAYHVLGFTVDERDRHERFVLTERPNVLPLLIDAGLTKTDCARIVMESGIELPRVYRHLPNANCIGCVKATSPTYWNAIRRLYPEVFARRAEQSRRIGARLVRYRGERIYLDDLPPPRHRTPDEHASVRLRPVLRRTPPQPARRGGR